MKKMDMAVGSVVLLGFLFLLGGVICKFSDLSLLEPYVTSPAGFFAVANTCFLLALVVDRFSGKE